MGKLKAGPSCLNEGMTRAKQPMGWQNHQD